MACYWRVWGTAANSNNKLLLLICQRARWACPPPDVFAWGWGVGGCARCDYLQGYSTDKPKKMFLHYCCGIRLCSASKIVFQHTALMKHWLMTWISNKCADRHLIHFQGRWIRATVKIPWHSHTGKYCSKLNTLNAFSIYNFRPGCCNKTATLSNNIHFLPKAYSGMGGEGGSNCCPPENDE